MSKYVTTVLHILAHVILGCWYSWNNWLWIPESVKNHGEQHKFPKQRNNQWCGGDDFCEQ